MQVGFYLSAAGAYMQSLKMDQVTNNLVNADTPGFKRDYMTFRVRLEEALESHALQRDPTYDRDGGGLLVKETATDFSEGAMLETDKPLDLALKGENAFFKVRDTESGEYLYTRSGAFTLNEEGHVVLYNHRFELMDQNDQPFVFDPEKASEFSFKDDGTLIVAGEPYANKKVAVYEVANKKAMVKNGMVTYKTPDTNVQPATNFQMRAGFLEKPGIDVSREYVNMIVTQRAYQINMDMLSKQDQTLQRGIQTIAAQA